MPTTNGFQKPPFFGRVSDSGLTVEIIDEDGIALSFHIDEALALIEARRYAERFGQMEVNTLAFNQAAPLAASEILL